MVSSGAVGMGLRTRTGANIDTEELSSKQALAALGQVELMNMWRGLFELLGIDVAQVLLTRQDLSQGESSENAINTLNTLLNANVLPVVNENDSVATDEIRFGDNDMLACVVGSLVKADLIINLTQAPGLLDFSQDRNKGILIPEVFEINDSLYKLVCSDISPGGTGGMASKLHAAKEASSYGAFMVIASSSRKNVLSDILQGEGVGTLFCP